MVVDPTAELARMLDQTLPQERYQLRLYITGSSPKSLQAVSTLRALCEEHLADRHELEIIDLYQQPAAAEDQIVAAPTLLKTQPKPARRVVGDLTDREKILIGLNIQLARDSDGGMTTWVKL